MSSDFHTLANSYIADLTPYQPGKPIEELERELGITSAIKLASNENALGPSPLALAAAQEALANLHIYPDGGCYRLKQALAKFLNVDSNQLTIGNGSENILEIIIKAYLQVGRAAVLSQYAFLTIPLLIKSSGAKTITVPARNFGHDIPKMIAAVTPNTRIIFVVNPNNPTGTYTNAADLKLLLDSVSSDVLVVVDEAYNEFIDREDYPDTLQLLSQYPNVIISRTFSKAYGLAGLRIGYAVSSPQIADILNRARMPFNVNSVAAVAATAALSDRDHVERTVEMNKMGMRQLITGLEKLNLEFIPSLGNFITVDVKKSGVEFYQQLLQEGVIIRPLVPYGMPNHVRLTIGTAAQNLRLLLALEKVLSESTHSLS